MATNNTVYIHDLTPDIDLSKTVPRYEFTLANQCKIRDVTFVSFEQPGEEANEGRKRIMEVVLFLGEDGEVYAQPLDDVVTG